MLACPDSSFPSWLYENMAKVLKINGNAGNRKNCLHFVISASYHGEIIIASYFAHSPCFALSPTVELRMSQVVDR